VLPSARPPPRAALAQSSLAASSEARVQLSTRPLLSPPPCMRRLPSTALSDILLPKLQRSSLAQPFW
jgi:hypothetical protein